MNSLGGAKIPYFVHKWRHGALLYLANTLKLFLWLLTAVEITAIRKLCRSDCYYFSIRVDLRHPLIIWGLTVPEADSYTLKSIYQYNC